MSTLTSLEKHEYEVLHLKLPSGSTIGEETKLCEKDTDYCYNATAPVFSFSTFQKAGCNTLICQVGPHNKKI